MDSGETRTRETTATAGPFGVQALLDEWFDADRPSMVAPYPVWVGRFRSLGGFVYERQVVEMRRPRRPLTLYRAAGADAAGGMSWTPFRLVAAAFAIQYRDRCAVWSAVVEPQHMLAAIRNDVGGAWGEIVCDPAGVRPERFSLPDRVSWSTLDDDRAALTQTRQP